MNVPAETKENIEKLWKKIVEENPNLLNGENHCVEEIIYKLDNSKREYMRDLFEILQ